MKKKNVLLKRETVCKKVSFLDFGNEHNVDLISKREIVLNNHTIRIKYATYSPSLDEKHI